MLQVPFPAVRHGPRSDISIRLGPAVSACDPAWPCPWLLLLASVSLLQTGVTESLPLGTLVKWPCDHIVQRSKKALISNASCLTHFYFCLQSNMWTPLKNTQLSASFPTAETGK